jgi:hypothetical protein
LVATNAAEYCSRLKAQAWLVEKKMFRIINLQIAAATREDNLLQPNMRTWATSFNASQCKTCVITYINRSTGSLQERPKGSHLQQKQQGRRSGRRSSNCHDCREEFE